MYLSSMDKQGFQKHQYGALCARERVAAACRQCVGGEQIMRQEDPVFVGATEVLEIRQQME